MYEIAARVQLLISQRLTALNNWINFLDDEERNLSTVIIKRKQKILNEMLNQLQVAIANNDIKTIVSLHNQILDI